MSFLSNGVPAERAVECHLALAGGFAAVGLAALLNQLPLWVASAPTTATVAAYLFGQARDQIGQLGPSLLAVAVAGAAGFAIWPRAFPALPNPLADFSPAALTSRRFVTAVIFSYLAAGAWLGYFTLYYWIGTTFFGVWSPVELPFRDVMSGAFPPAFPLFVGAGAAIAEEVVFRLFAIPAGVLALTWIWQRQRGRPPGSRARTALLGVVIVVVAAVWGSLHSTYPQLPFFVRALEVTIIGIFAGLVLLRWGLVATMLTHYVGNTSIVGALFFLSGNAVLQGAALLIIALPLLLLAPAAISVVRGRPLADLPLQPVIVTRQPAPAPPRTVVERPAGAWWPALLVVGALGVVAAFAPPRPTDGLRMALTREGAIALASSRAAQAGAPDGWPLVVADVIDTSAGLEATYLLRTVGPSETARFYQSELPPAIWQVRFLRPLQKDEVAIQLDPVGELVGIVRQVEEAAPGESPSIEEARAIAERWLGELSGRRDWMLVSQSQTRRERRLDSSFVWQRPGWKAGEATLRTQVLLYGDALGAYQPFLKVPETFVRQLRQDTGLEGLVRALRDLGLVAGAAVLGVVFLRAFRGWEANLAFGGALALAAALAGLLVLATSVPAVLAGFITTLDLPTFAVWTITGRLREGLFLVAGVVAVGALAPALLGRAGRRIRPASGREIILGALGALGLAVGSYAVWTIQAFVAPATLRPPGGLPPFEMLPPALFTLGAAIQSALGVGLGVAVLLLLLDRLRPTPRLVLAALAGALYLAANGVGPAEIAIGALLGAVGGLLLLGFWRAVGPSLWIPPIAVGGALLLRDMVGLIVLGDAGWYLSNGIAIPLLAFVLGGVLARRTRQPRPSSAPETRQ
ncbi:MAG: CPBP family glutamic-type intramembrane protease [Dehalococcoidia bacterium]